MIYSISLVLTILMFAIVPLQVLAYDFQECADCHYEALTEDKARVFLHPPFAQMQCDACHAAASSDVLDSAADLAAKRKINWLWDSAMENTSHAFLLPGDKLRDTLVVELHQANGEIMRHEIKVPPLNGLAEMQDSGKPPTISDIQVKVRRAGFFSATIGWQTDTLTDAHVRYGIQDLSQTSISSNRLGRQHQIVLHNLRPNTTYRFSVVSRDLFGRNQAAEPMTLSTSMPSAEPQPDIPDNGKVGGVEAAFVSSFQRLQRNYVLELALGQPSSVYIGSRGAPDESGGWPEEVDEYHAGLSSKVVIAMKACLNCHNVHDHPVNISPKQEMVIPPEYPTLPNGRISCTSCHAPHGSNHEYLTRKNWQTELCMGCHKTINNKMSRD